MKDEKTFDQTLWNPDEYLWNFLFEHRGHKVEIATYGDWNNPSDICLECMDCNQVILDAEIYTICGRGDE